jgi:hypothetical protein
MAHSRGACVAVAVPRVICALACACDWCETNTHAITRTHTGRFAEQPALFPTGQASSHCAETEPEQSSRTASRCGKTRDTWNRKQN